jgi:hypothetical protein
MRKQNRSRCINDRFNTTGWSEARPPQFLLFGFLLLSCVLVEEVPRTFLRNLPHHIQAIPAWNTSLGIAQGDDLMWKTLILGSLMSVLCSAQAMAVCSSYPNTLTNGTTADASQVMANLNCAALTSGSTINALTLTGTTAIPGSGVIDSAGEVITGKNTASSNVIGIALEPTGDFAFTADLPGGHYSIVNSPTGAGTWVQFRNNGTTVGSIAIGASSTAFNTTSDRRLKQNIRDADFARIDAAFDDIRVRQWDWRESSNGAPGEGFVAQELFEDFPQVVTKGDDGNRKAGDPGFQPWYVDYGKLTPYLVVEVQLLKKRLVDLQHVNEAALKKNEALLTENAALHARDDARDDIKVDFKELRAETRQQAQEIAALRSQLGAFAKTRVQTAQYVGIK